MFEEFRIKAIAAGAEIFRFTTEDEALDFILSFLEAEGVSDSPGLYALWQKGTFAKDVNEIYLEERVPGLKFQITRETAADSLVGISEMEYALSDTGSLVANQTLVEHRLVSTLPDIHMAITYTYKILEGKVDLFRKMNPANNRYIAFITGPSRTADIERVLTIGVHGPKRLIIIFIDDEIAGE